MRCPACHKINDQGALTCSFCGFQLNGRSDRLQPTAPVSERAVSDVAFTKGSLIAGRYLVERELGRGGTGVVYLVRDLKLNEKQVALKFFSPTFVDSDAKRR